jgi:hypothetical protein
MENIEAMLCAFIEGDLDEAGRAQIEKHLESNPQHRKLLNELMELREMVKALPRVKAPMDVGDSLRQKVERSMLLEDAGTVAAVGRQADRWPQYFAIAAMFLLVSALCFIVYHALAPTMKPARFTQAVDRFQSASPGRFDDGKLDDSAMASKRAEVTDEIKSLAIDKAQAVTPSAPVSPALQQYAMQGARQIMNGAQQVLSQAQNSTLGPVDLIAIRRRLQNSGYGIDQSKSRNNATTLVLVNSSDLPATKQQITQFLSNNNGISWNAVPEDVETQKQETQSKAPVPGGLGGAGPMQSVAAPGADATATQQTALQPMVMDKVAGSQFGMKLKATTQPSSDVYVARGLTAQQVDALRQTLSVPQNGSAVQVTVGSAEQLATVEGAAATQPAIAMPKDVNVLGFANNSPTSQPSEAANSGADLAAPGTTLPSDGVAGAREREAEGNSVGGNSQALEPVDAVIVVQPTAAVVTGAAPAGTVSTGVVSGGATTRADVDLSAPPVAAPRPVTAAQATQPAGSPATQP